LNFFPLPHGHGALRSTFSSALIGCGFGFGFPACCGEFPEFSGRLV